MPDSSWPLLGEVCGGAPHREGPASPAVYCVSVARTCSSLRTSAARTSGTIISGENFRAFVPQFSAVSLHVSSLRDLRDFVQLSQPAMGSSELPHHSGGCGQNSQFSGVAANSNNRNLWRPFGVRTCCSTFRLMRAHVMIYMTMHTLWPEVYLGGWLSDAEGAEGVTIREAKAAPRTGLVLLHASSLVLCLGWMESQSG